MSTPGRGRGRGRVPKSPQQIEDESAQSMDNLQRAGAPIVSGGLSVVSHPPEELTMDQLAERYADAESSQEVEARREIGMMQITTPDTSAEIPPAASTGRGRFRGRGASIPTAQTVEVGGGHGKPVGSLASPTVSTTQGQFDDTTDVPLGRKQVDPQTVTSGSQNEAETVRKTEKSWSTGAAAAAGAAASTIANPASTSTKRSKVPEADLPTITRIGAKGTKIEVATNYIRLSVAEGLPGVVEYHVSYSEPLESVGLRRKSLRQFEHVLGHVRSFDGMILFLPFILDEDVTVLHGLHPVESTELTVHITFVKVKAMRDAVPFFNILLRRIMVELKFVELRNEFYDLELVQILDKHRLQIWPGMSVTAEDQEAGLMINVDTCSRVLRTDTLYDYYMSVKADPKMKQKFNDFVINKIVLTKYNNTTYRIDDVAWDMTPESEFEHKNGPMTFKNYLKMQYNQTVQFMNQPMLISKLKPRKNERMRGETTQRMAALVPEFCHLTGLTEDQRANFKVMTDLAESTRLTPQQREAGLNKFIARVMGSERVKEMLAEWNLVIDTKIIHVEGRKIDGPQLLFNRRSNAVKVGPDFSREAGLGVCDPVEVKKYVLICTQRDSDKARRFIEVYKQVTGPLGIKMMQLGEIVPLRGYQPHDFRSALEKLNKNETQFVVIIMPMQRDDVYGAIKKFCVSDFAIPSQCIISKTLGNEKRLRSIVLKIALQINCKLGGSLWALKMPLTEQVMFVGIDVAHDPLKKDPSTICLVASLNNECTQYYSRASTTKVHQEMADSLRIMMEDALKHFKKARGEEPNRIIIFRDGGSVGAMEHIEKTEMNQMMRARDDHAPKAAFTFAIVAKRIPQRFFLKTGATRYDNLQPGSVVDQTVTRRTYFDFYMVSQQVRHGTVNPTHFVVMNPNDEIKTDLIQKLAYVTSFMYYNWSGTVRVPAMVQYAHKLADLLSRHVKAPPNAKFSSTLYYL
ncbi:unnamed protein product [Orchesella dallaii]|uniref:Piwi-like protein 1 n=1 Tax=Orchesella dallaii TaxID=48710 RepID=A0ABP1RZH3_9HEXA